MSKKKSKIRKFPIGRIIFETLNFVYLYAAAMTVCDKKKITAPDAIIIYKFWARNFSACRKIWVAVKSDYPFSRFKSEYVYIARRERAKKKN